MYVFVTWASLAKTKIEAGRIQESLQTNPDQPPVELDKVLPEYAEYLKAIEGADEKLLPDEYNSEILGVRFAVPSLKKIVTYKLGRRLSDKSSVLPSLAARAFLLNTFEQQWTGDFPPKPNNVTFVGLPGLRKFLRKLAFASSVLDSSLPFDLWHEPPVLELNVEDIDVFRLFAEYAKTATTEHNRQIYTDVIHNWKGAGCSIDRDSTVLLTLAIRLGLKIEG